jgi:cyclase
VQFEGLRKLGDPADFARRYADEGADELLFLDTVASLYHRDAILDRIERTTEGVFIPFTVGGGVRSLQDIRNLLRSGADKVALNTAAIQSPEIIRRAADCVGSQAIVVSVEAKRVNGGWEAYTDQGRNPSGKDAVAWCAEAVNLGAGEILLTSIDRDGTRKGPDMGLVGAVEALELRVPVVLAGGIGTPEHAVEASGAANALAIGAALHSRSTTIPAVKAALAQAGHEVR